MLNDEVRDKLLNLRASWGNIPVMYEDEYGDLIDITSIEPTKYTYYDIRTRGFITEMRIAIRKKEKGGVKPGI